MNQDEKLMKISVQKVLKNKPIKEEYKKEYPDWMRTIIQGMIVLYVGSVIQGEIIKQYPELRQEVRRMYLRAIVCSLFLTILTGLIFWVVLK